MVTLRNVYCGEPIFTAQQIVPWIRVSLMNFLQCTDRTRESKIHNSSDIARKTFRMESNLWTNLQRLISVAVLCRKCNIFSWSFSASVDYTDILRSNVDSCLSRQSAILDQPGESRGGGHVTTGLGKRRHCRGCDCDAGKHENPPSWISREKTGNGVVSE